MSSLVNLSNEECVLLVELLKAKQEQLQSAAAQAESQDAGEDARQQQEVLEQLLWHVRLGCSEPSPEDAELRQIGSYV
jgi:hypothetical protein